MGKSSRRIVINQKQQINALGGFFFDEEESLFSSLVRIIGYDNF